MNRALPVSSSQLIPTWQSVPHCDVRNTVTCILFQPLGSYSHSNSRTQLLCYLLIQHMTFFCKYSVTHYSTAIKGFVQCKRPQLLLIDSYICFMCVLVYVLLCRSSAMLFRMKSALRPNLQ